MRALSWGLALFLGLVAPSAAQIPGEEYHNVPFHFSVRLPAGYEVCTGDPLITDHGLMLIAPGRKCSPISVRTAPAIGIYAGFNVTGPAGWDTVEELGKETCDSSKGTLRPSSDGLRVPGQDSIVCETRYANGNLETTVISLVKRPNVEPVLWDVLILHVLSNPMRQASDMAAFKRMLATIKFDPLVSGSKTPDDFITRSTGQYNGSDPNYNTNLESTMNSAVMRDRQWEQMGRPAGKML